MKRRLSFAAMGLVLGTTALGFATHRDLSAFNSHQAAAPLVHRGEATETRPRRVYCFIGTKGAPDSLFRGWICDAEHAPASMN
jgi:hypothetical protein